MNDEGPVRRRRGLRKIAVNSRIQNTNDPDGPPIRVVVVVVSAPLIILFTL